MRKTHAALMAIGLAATAGLAGMESASAQPTAFSCPSKNVCFYTGTSGSGQRCAWNVSDNDWLRGDVKCSWASPLPVVRSMYISAGAAGSVTYYAAINHVNPIGCMNGRPTGTGGTFVEPISILSHRLSSASCST
ncbi:peptidase inhibitor family I36 protein [Streptomyces sp. B1866]|uniref:peptidase inhibitor family I36 protein n=1 Tax=Streptomyces sp. B1866 TaxID=3075431 RepID=UPI0028928247|nr:peptidase inhibitor family I36 protein [Streptomyces sp. B1866]MDT3396786.1 peptidase inhibitor family I36 protein [Streptomyces sp. B1866]